MPNGAATDPSFAESFFRNLVEAAPDAVVVVEEGRIVFVNVQTEKLFGYGRDELLGQPIEILVPKRHRGAHPGHRDGYAQKPRPRSMGIGMSLAGRRKDGTEFPAEISLAPIPTAKGLVVQVVVRDLTERRRSDEALRESQAQLRLISENVLDLVAQVSLDGAFVYASPNYETVLGYPPQRLCGTSAFAPVHPEDLERVQAAFAQAIQQGRGSVEFRVRHADGHYVWVDTLGKVFIDETGAPGGAVLSTRDITDRKQSEDQQRQSQQRFRTLFEEAPLGMALIDSLTGRIYEANLRFAEIVGRTRAELATIDWMTITHPDDVQEDLSNMALMNAGKTRGFNMTKRYRHPDGSNVWIHMTVARLAVEDTIHPRHVCMIEDITERMRTDESLRLESAALQAAADAIVITDRAGVIEWINPAFVQLTGYSAEEAVGKHHRDLVMSGKHARAFFKDLWETILAGRTWRGEIVNRRKDGSLYTEDQAITPILDATGAVTHFVAIQQDITEHLQLEAQLRQSQKMESVGQLASGVAHDFNNLLSVVLTYTTLVLDELKPGDPIRADIEEVKRAGERAGDLTRQLLAFSRQQVLQPRILDLNVVLAGMEKMLRRLLGEAVDLSLLTFTRLAKVHADAGQVEQIVMNLVVNARDALPDGGKLSIETGNIELDAAYAAQHPGVTPGSYVMLAVTDTGFGMDSVTRERIFEPFFTTKEKGKGTGLGLATVFGIVKQSNGHIWVYSEPGKGTTFKVYFPRSHEVTEPASLAPPPVGTLRGSETVLLVEDDDQVRALARAVLGRNGYNVLEAQNGGEAFLICEQYSARIHILLTDVVMPRMSGKQLVERLAPLRPEMKVLFMSGYTDKSIVHHGVLDAGIAFLQKPITPDALLRKLRETLGPPRT